MNGYFTFLLAPGLDAHHQIYFCVISNIPVTGSYSNTEVQSMYSTVPINWTIIRFSRVNKLPVCATVTTEIN